MQLKFRMGRVLDKDRDRGWGNCNRNRDSYSLDKDIHMGNCRGSCWDMDTGKDKDCRNPLSMCMNMYMSESNSMGSHTAFDTAMGKCLYNPDRSCWRCTAIPVPVPEEPGSIFESKFQSLLSLLPSLMIYKDGVLKLYCENNFRPEIANTKNVLPA